ncbi:MAG TPA: amidohydrolase family protein [Gemmatimonadales bacterium]|nr:amidohydrolase family protein [Gemmatimonadales bacterium]
MLRVRAGRVYPVTAPPLDDGAVLVGDDGRIAAVGPNASVPSPPATELLEYRDAVLVPGLVNCHTHLELTHLAGQNREDDFTRWIRRVRELKQETKPEQFLAAATQGVRDFWARGVTCVADTGDSGAPLHVLAELGGRGIYYQEVFGPDPAQVEESMAGLRVAVHALRPLATSQLRLGVSPHAPYTVSAPLYRAVAQYARSEHLPVAVHLAESRAESDLVRDGAGPFADALARRGITFDAQHVSPVEYLHRLGVLDRALCIHCVQIDTMDIELLKADKAAVAHCPLSNRAHHHGTAPLAELRRAGVPTGLGTDSVVSVGELDLWAEAQAAGLSEQDALHMLTIEGARALGWETEIGSLEVGKAGDLAILTGLGRPLPPPAALLTVVAGKVVSSRLSA